MSELHEAIEAFVNPNFEGWLIQKKNDEKSVEDFVPLTLLQSFIECEIQFPESILLFDQVTTTLRNSKYQIDSGPGKRIVFSYDLIRAAVVEVLFKFPDQRSPFWLANYDSSFGLESTTDRADNYVDARNASTLRKLISEVLTGGDNQREFDKTSQDIVVERILKYIRYCGFYRIDKEFLENFVVAICYDSSKAILPYGGISNEEFLQLLQREEGLLLHSRDMDSSTANTILDVVNENICRGFLIFMGFVTAPSQQRSRLQLRSLLNEAENRIRELSNGEPDTQSFVTSLVCRRVVELFIDTGIKPKYLIASLDEISISQEYKAFRQAQNQSLGLINFLRNLVRGSLNLTNLTSIPLSESATYFGALSEILDQRSTNHKIADQNYLEIECDQSIHPILNLGRFLRIHIDDDPSDETEFFDFSNLANDSAGIVHVVLTDKKIGGEYAQRFGEFVVAEQIAMVPIRKAPFENQLSKDVEIRDITYQQIAKLFPFMLSWKEEPFALPKLVFPAHLKKRELNALESAERDVSNGQTSSACHQASRLFESKLRLYCMMIYNFLRRVDNTLPLPGEDGRAGGIGTYIDYLKHIDTNQLPAELKKCISNSQDLESFHEIRILRNRFLHHDISINPKFALDFIFRVATNFSRINNNTVGIGKIVSFPGKGKVIYFDYMGNVNSIENDTVFESRLETMPKSRKFDVEKFAILGYYLTEKRPNRLIGTAYCTECGTPIALTVYSSRLNCTAKCKRPTALEGDWAHVMREAINAINPRKTEEKADMTSNKNRSNWIRAIGEGVSMALGPFGAPLKVVLNKFDRDDFDSLEKKIDSISDKLSIESVSSLIITETGFENLPVKVSEEFAYWIVKSRQNYPNSTAISKTILPFSATRLMEEEIIVELSHIYEGRVDLFWTDMASSGVNLSRIRRSGLLEAEAREIVYSFRGASLEQVVSVLATLHEKNMGSNVLQTALNNSQLFLENGI